MIRAVLFDVGGTLHVADNTPALADRFSELLIRRLAESGIVLPVDAKSLTPMLHRNAEDYKHWSEQTRRELSGVRIWNEYYLRDFAVGEARLAPIAEELSWMYDAIRVRNVPRPHMQETMAALQEMGMKLGIISNIISTTFVPRLLEDYGIAEKMSCVILSSVAGIRKPDPEIFRLGAKGCGVTCAEMAYVGDTLSRDVLGCRNAKVGLCIQIRNPSIAHRDTAFQNTGLAPDVQIDDLAEIPELIRSKNSSQP
ncbi:HAD family hydrolase [Dysosmobacter sp.]|jgi:putative hydrolase of the HAD superfamily|uniref:HAD family hydrolase n=1 Tax=Dysosmobacter sp. TaxID=2591382 RepID=UPI002D7E5376|nr:HAD family hydrolase [uncultured Oscillibacter sp.]